MGKSRLILGESSKELKQLSSNTIDSVVCDPPYGLKFMGKTWDYSIPSVDLWKEVLRVLKPGGHLLSFAGTRTYHRMVVNIEDSGFEIRDCLQWLHGSGFPKSHNISKAIDKKLGKDQTTTYQPNYKNKVCGKGYGGGKTDTTTKPITDLAKKYYGVGTALKPANEPIVLARKPLSEKTIADNILKWGTGGLSIDVCRINPQAEDNYGRSAKNSKGVVNAHEGFGDAFKIKERHLDYTHELGRWPTNVILSHSNLCTHVETIERCGEQKALENRWVCDDNCPVKKLDEQNNASRFFYCAKASPKEKGPDNKHPTVKPIKLMAYLIALVTPPQGKVLDPFMGSGSTGVAALADGFRFIGIEKEPEYFRIAESRILLVG